MIGIKATVQAHITIIPGLPAGHNLPGFDTVPTLCHFLKFLIYSLVEFICCYHELSIVLCHEKRVHKLFPSEYATNLLMHVILKHACHIFWQILLHLKASFTNPI